jgi:hypothetical protein
MTRIVYKEIASILIAIGNCATSNNETWAYIWPNVLDDIIKNYLPHGSGIDNGVTVNKDKSSPNKIVLEFGFHEMDSNGYYCGWADYTLYVRPSLAFDIDLKLHGRDYNGLKDYLYELFQYMLMREIPESEYADIIAQYHNTESSA